VLNAGGSQGKRRLRTNEYAWSVWIIALATAVGLMLRARLQIIDQAMLFLLAVVVVGYRYRRGPALLASVLSIAAFDFAFVPPYYTFNVHDTAYYLTFGVMLAVALSMGQLTARIREQAQDAGEREARAHALYALSRDLLEAEELQDRLAVATRHISEAGHGEAHVFLGRSQGALSADDWPAEGLFESLDVRVAAIWAYQHGESAGWGTRHCAEAEALVVPLKSPTRVIGVVTLRPRSLDEAPSPARWEIVEALAHQAAVAFERTTLSVAHQQARVEVESNHLRTAPGAPSRRPPNPAREHRGCRQQQPAAGVQRVITRGPAGDGANDSRGIPADDAPGDKPPRHGSGRDGRTGGAEGVAASGGGMGGGARETGKALALHSTFSRYPTPGSVSSNLGWVGSASSLCLSWVM
jgi:Osmosensitive K+ channel histidine kinase